MVDYNYVSKHDMQKARERCRKLNRDEVEEIRIRNIIDMAMGFSAMSRVFADGSTTLIQNKIYEIVLNLKAIGSKQEFDNFHDYFCLWFMENIWTAERTKDGKTTKETARASYGHGAKVLDVVLKVLVDYCHFPDQETAKKLIPWLNSAIDTNMMKYLKYLNPGKNIEATTIEDVDRDTYILLQDFVRGDITTNFQVTVTPVDWDDILWRLLNREII